MIVQDPDFPSQEAVIRAVPLSTALTLPLPSTVATEGLEELQDTFWFVASEGETLALSRAEPPTSSIALGGDTDTELTGTVSDSGEVEGVLGVFDLPVLVLLLF